MATVVLEVLDYSANEPDRLLVRGMVDSRPGKIVTAKGWLSAMTHHISEEEYAAWEQAEYDRRATPQKRGQRGPSIAKGKEIPIPFRVMTPAEKLDYCKRLLEEQYPSREPIPGTPLDIST